ncbi:MAG TPA: hypothetical protein VN176_04045, partial [Verrucomicrobiae bacterium]|nr:hypothetical protein [Verrucomicrobiae bacterium]
MKPSGWPNYARSCASASRFLSLVAFVALLIASPSSARAAAPAVKTGPPVRTAASPRAVAPAPMPQAAAPGPRIWLGAAKPLSTNYVGANAPAQSGTSGRALTLGGNPGPGGALPHQILSSGQATPLALVSGDFNEDGYADLAVGYASAGGGIVAIHRGNIDAFAPQSDASFQAIAHGNFPPSFLPDAQVFSVPVRPDFIATGKFTVNGHQDLVIGANGGTTLYVLAGDGKGNFAAPEMVALPGGLTVLAAGHLGGSGVFTALVAGISIPGQQSDLVVMHGSEQGLTPLKVLALDGPASNIVFGDFGSGPDAAFLAGGQTVLLHSSRMELETLQLPVSATALTVGDFINDRDPRVQLALLASDGSVYIAAHNSFDPRPFTQDEWQIMRQATVNGLPNPLVPASPANEGWKIVETVPSASIYSGQVPVFFRTRISGNAADDVMVLNASAGELTLISHPNLAAGATTFLPGQVSVRPYNAKPVAAIPLRNNIDGRPGVIALHQGETVPQALTPLPDPTFNVDTTNDVVVANACNPAAPIVGSCSLREAIIEANATPGVDTIMVPAGTYTLTIADGGTDKHDATTGELSITDGVNIVGFLDGSGNPVSIIQACSVLPTPIATTPFATCGGTGIIEKPFSVNPGFTKAFDTAFTNLEIRFGFNPGTFAGDGFGGGFDWEASKTGTMTVTSCNIHDNRIHDGRGAGITATNTGGGTGQFTMSNSTVANNVASRTGTNSGSGGGIFFGSATRFTITNTHIDNNQAINGNSEGGGIFAFNPGTTPISVIHGGTISGNSAITRGGGVRSSAGITIDQGTIISGNTAGEGAGVWSNLGTSVPFPAGETTTLNKVAITGNNATGNGTLPTPGIGGGGGIKVDNSASGNFFVMSFSRLAGNTSALGGSNLFSTSPGAAVTATNNWWGTNAAASTIGGGATVNCPTPLAGQICFDPFIVLTHSASPAIIRINQSTTLTGDMSQDNHGTALVLTNLNRILGRPITFDAPVLGTIPDAQPENLDANAQATATFNAGGVSGRGSAHATVDQAIISANSNLIASATESTTTVTITTVGTHNFAVGETVVISGVGVGGYNGTFAITATTPTTFNYTTTAGLGASSGGLANVGILILEPLHITKSFNPTPVATNTSSTLTFSVTNPNVIAVDSSFTDTLPANLVVANPPGTTNTCGGTFAPAAGDTSLTFTNGTLGVGSCAISVNVTSAVDNIYSNSVTINSTAAGTGAASTSSANLTVINPPTINKVFGAATIPLNGTTSLTFTISSSNQNQTLSGIGFTDSLPSGLVVATPNGLTNTCSTTPTAVAGSGTVSLTGASLAPGASCTISVNVQGTTAGLKSNSVTVSDTIAGTGNTSSTSLTVVAPPTISKAFNPTSIPLNGTSTLTFTINNPNTTAAADLTGVAFSDTLPLSSGSGSATLVVSSTPNVSNTCGGTVTATAGTGVISLSGASVAHNASCTLSVDVKGTVEGDGNNTTGAITSTEGGTGTTSNTALLKVVAPPTISKAFGAASIPLNGTTTVTFTIANPASNTSAESGIAFSDTLTNGLQVASTPGVSNTCNGTVTATANSTSISLSGGSIGTPGTTCTIVVNVTGTVAGSVSNTTGAVSSTNGGTGATSNTATLLVVAPATVIKTFAPTKIPLNGTTLLTINITNPNSTVSLTGLSFTDSLPAGLVVASTPNLNNTCGGTATATGGSSSVTLSGGTVASSASCAVSVNVQGTTAGDKINNVVVSSTEGGASTGASATVTVVAPPTISKAFNPTSVARNGTSTVTFTISNPNNPGTPANGDLTGVAFSDTLPVSSGPGSATLAVAATPSVSNTCGGTVTATAGTGVISLSGASVAHNSSCTVSVNVTGTVEGDGNNTTGAISSTEGGTGTTSNTATLNVVAPPTISKAFGAANITLNGTTTVTFTITNPASNTSAENGIAFSDTLTNGLQVASTPGVSNTCGGTVTAAANSTSISLTGGSIATPGATCTVVVNVTGTQSGTVTNTTGAVS